MRCIPSMTRPSEPRMIGYERSASCMSRMWSMMRRTVGVGPNLNQKSVSTSAIESSITSLADEVRTSGDEIVYVPGVQAVGTGFEVVLLAHSAILSQTEAERSASAKEALRG